VITEALQQLAGVFSRRFFFNALLPTFVFTSITIGVVALSGSQGPAVVTWWGKLDVLTRLLVALMYLAAVYFLAAAVASQWRNIVRVFEGYPLLAFVQRRRPRRRWGRPRARLAVGQRWHIERMRQLQSDEAGDRAKAYYRYPLQQGKLVLPTRLGNILLAGERYAHSRYGIDTVYFWPRLYPLLPETFQRDYGMAVSHYQFPLVVAFQASVTTAICSVTFLLTHAPVWLFLVVLFGGSTLAYAAYVLSLSSAEEMAELQRAAFDLYRGLLLTAWPAARDITDQREAFRAITRFIEMGVQRDWDTPRDQFLKRQASVDQGPE
jgi:hypothetical protein